MRTPSPELTVEERDSRTVMCMQLSRNCTPRDLREFFRQHVGKVRDVRIIADKRVSSRTKGIAYVEFREVDSVSKALTMSGQKLLGVPLMVMLTGAEKNRLAAMKAKDESVPRRMTVSNLPPTVTTEQLTLLFQPFGKVTDCQVYPALDGAAPSSGFVEFETSEEASQAFLKMNNFTILERTMRLSLATESSLLDREDAERSGVPMTAANRSSLMSKLSGAGPPAGLVGPLGLTNSRFLLLRNMFNPEEETDEGWEEDIRDEVLEECSKHGPICHIHVDKHSQGHVYLKFLNPDGAATALQALNGRFFAGRQVVAEYQSEAAYLHKCPDAITALTILEPDQD